MALDGGSTSDMLKKSARSSVDFLSQQGEVYRLGQKPAGAVFYRLRQESW
jgi:hypothetical protein